MSNVMTLLPENLIEFIILHCILLKRKENGWEKIHFQLKNSKIFLKQTGHVFDNSLEFEIAIRMPCKSLYDVFSMDEDGNYLDDICDEIMYW
jgi:hypothetical protein